SGVTSVSEAERVIYLAGEEPAERAVPYLPGTTPAQLTADPGSIYAQEPNARMPVYPTDASRPAVAPSLE
ncbi:MAG TPA: hypothetical protein VJZ91_18170, partial [Blastocatellia bacterium]|nr:hypothetical protein [Blastocatellia bacterium]